MIPTTQLSRRTILGATVAGSAVTFTPAAGAAESPSASFAMLTDSHANVDRPDRTAWTRRALDHIAARNPDFVLHGGDITEYGSAEEYALHQRTVPADLKPLMHYVPGNHESQWDAYALEHYREHVGPTRYSFTTAGLHVIGIDPLVSQQWPSWQFSQDLLDFIRKDLAQVPAGIPIVILTHFPISDDYLFVSNADEFLAVIEPYPVRLVFSGHIHKRRLRTFNGLTHLTGAAMLKEPVYYWAERLTTAAGDRLRISEVTVPENGSPTETVVAEAPLDAVGPGDDLGPLTLTARGDARSVRVRALVDPSTRRGAPQIPSDIAARVYPMGMEPSDWQPLVQRGRSPRWEGHIDATALPPGAHRVQVRASNGGEDPVWIDTVDVDIPADAPTITWEHALGSGTVVADLAHDGDTVFVGSVTGVLDALKTDSDGVSTVWRRDDLGGIYKGPKVLDEAGVLLVGSTDHHLRALDLKTGTTRWSTDLGAPVQCGIALLDLPQGRRISVAAGTQLHILTFDGQVEWSSDLGGTFTGAACTDGARVFAGSGSGEVIALDARDGSRLWSTMVARRTDSAYHKLIFGPWAAQLQMLETGDVLVPTHGSTTAVNSVSGEERWTVTGLHRDMFTRAIVSEHGVLLLDGKEGDALLVDQSSGETIWKGKPFPFVGGSGASHGSSPIGTADPDLYWMVATTGMLTRIDLSTPEFTILLKVSNSFTTSTAALVSDGSLLVTVDHQGMIRGVTGLDGASR